MASSNNFPQERILILADSRGIGLKQELSRSMVPNFWLIIRKGSPTREIVTRAALEIKAYEPSQIYILTGICSITHLNRSYHTVSPRFPCPEEAARSYENDMQQVVLQINHLLHRRKPLIIFAPVVGLDMAKYNRRTDITDYLTPQQQIINNSVKSINAVIIQRNSALDIATPWLQRTIHRNKNGKTTNGYYRLAPDGCHLSQNLREIWARELTTAVKKNTRFY